ncbi:MAG: NUDIX hydrolase [Acidimicrobiia bacterium]
MVAAEGSDAAIEAVNAAGGVVRRRTGDDPATDEIVVVHRPRYDDWSLPKGKLEPGETFEAAAQREVEEETGLRCALGRELSPVEYRDRKGRPKLVRYWLMDAADSARPFTPNAEVDRLCWCSPEDAVHLLSYEHDRELVRSLYR